MPQSANARPALRRPFNTALKRSDFGQDDIQILQMARYMFQSFADPRSHSWMHAIELADLLSAGSGNQILHNVLSFVQAVRCTRQSGFQFSNPHCARCSQRITAHERQFMACITAAKRGDLDKATGHAYLLCEGNDTSLVKSSLRSFAGAARQTSLG